MTEEGYGRQFVSQPVVNNLFCLPRVSRHVSPLQEFIYVKYYPCSA